MSYPNTSDFMSEYRNSAFWRATAGTRRFLFKWDGWDFVQELRWILFQYLTTPRVEWSQRVLGARDYIDLVAQFPLQVVARHTLSTYSTLPGATTARFDLATDWNGISVQPGEIMVGGPWWVAPLSEYLPGTPGAGARLDVGQTLSVNDLRGAYALTTRLMHSQDVEGLRVVTAMPADWAEALQQSAETGRLSRSAMQVLVVLVTATLLGTVDGPLAIDLPADTTMLVLNQEPKRPVSGPVPPEIIDVTNAPVPFVRPGTPTKELTTGAKTVVVAGAATLVGLAWLLLRGMVRANPRLSAAH